MWKKKQSKQAVYDGKNNETTKFTTIYTILQN